MNYEKYILKYSKKQQEIFPSFKFMYEKIFILVCMYDDDINLIKDIINYYNIKNNSEFVIENTLNCACTCNKNLSVIKFLVEQYLMLSNVSCSENLRKSFINACCDNENVEIIKYLYYLIITQIWYKPYDLKHGLQCAVQKNTNLEITKFFVNKIIEHNESQEYLPLNFLAFRNKNISILKYLMNFYPFLVCKHNNLRILTKFNEQNDPDNLNFIKELILNHIKNNLIVKNSICNCHSTFFEENQTVNLDSEHYDKSIIFRWINKGGEISRKIINCLTISELKLLVDLNANAEHLNKPIDIITHSECELNEVIIINKKKYMINKEIVTSKCKELEFLFNFEMIENDIIEIKIEKVGNFIINLYISSYFYDQYEKIDKLSTEKIIELCKIIDKYPNDMTIEKLEYFICSTFDQKYMYFYNELLERYKLYDLRRIVHIKKLSFLEKVKMRYGQNLFKFYNINKSFFSF